MLTHSAEETVKLGEGLGKRLSRGDVVALYGDMGSGKTTFTKGIGKGLGVKDARHINSPTFVLIKEYSADMPMYHLDLYRLDSLEDIENIAVDEYLYNSDGVTIIEWAEKIKKILPKRHIAVTFKIRSEKERYIDIRQRT